MSGDDFTMADAAILYATEMGWPLFPAHPTGKKPLIKPGRDFAENASRDPVQLREWFANKFHYASIAMPTGAASGVVVIDADAKHDGERVLAQLEDRYGALPRTHVVRTQSGGVHVYCAHPGNGVRAKSCVGGDSTPWPDKGVDVRGDGGIVLLPPSVGYVWERDEGETFMPLPAGWLDVLRADARRALPTAERAPYTGINEESIINTIYRGQLRELRTHYKRAKRDGNAQRAELIDRILRREALGQLGERDSCVTRAGYLIGYNLPELGPDVAESLAFMSIDAMPVEGDGDTQHWLDKFRDSYESGAAARAAKHEADRAACARLALAFRRGQR